VPSKSTQTGVTCGLPSGITVARCANDFREKRSKNLVGISVLINPPGFYIRIIPLHDSETASTRKKNGG
jgi:hypothetical protein